MTSPAGGGSGEGMRLHDHFQYWKQGYAVLAFFALVIIGSYFDIRGWWYAAVCFWAMLRIMAL